MVKEQQQAFDALKEAICAAPILAFPRMDKPFTMTVDASCKAVGGVLSQVGEDGREHPIAFISQRMNDAFGRKPPYEQELYAVYYCATKWNCFLEGSPHVVVVKTDHKSLESVLQAKSHPSRHMARWVQELSARYNLAISYVPGETNVVADALSRLSQT